MVDSLLKVCRLLVMAGLGFIFVLVSPLLLLATGVVLLVVALVIPKEHRVEAIPGEKGEN